MAASNASFVSYVNSACVLHPQRIPPFSTVSCLPAQDLPSFEPSHIRQNAAYLFSLAFQCIVKIGVVNHSQASGCFHRQHNEEATRHNKGSVPPTTIHLLRRTSATLQGKATSSTTCNVDATRHNEGHRGMRGTMMGMDLRAHSQKVCFVYVLHFLI